MFFENCTFIDVIRELIDANKLRDLFLSWLSVRARS